LNIPEQQIEQNTDERTNEPPDRRYPDVSQANHECRSGGYPSLLFHNILEGYVDVDFFLELIIFRLDYHNTFSLSN
jgi:hypothetical protein